MTSFFAFKKVRSFLTALSLIIKEYSSHHEKD